ncbi:hypothetical protein BJ138DRAFT_1119068 [Hygrophoropsis aurantiaca]|uniref:Uncharacterized protein n=1 Tax=Hygrophoropsis aurantiaca TaxID=72124 RepID=A0ACB7ZUT0_9AGAM|nr:hypothetical protein BJ138DRAFT_1119068 [Hygrophoropsis aurantiaca]
MPSQVDAPVTRRVTRAQNANAHPGQIVLDANRAAAQELNPSQRRPRKMKATVSEPQESPQEKAARMQRIAHQVAQVELKMQEAETQQAERPKGVRPQPRRKVKKVAISEDIEMDEADDVHGMDLLADVATARIEAYSADENIVGQTKKTAKPSKMLLRDAIKNARAELGSASTPCDDQLSVDSRAAVKKGNGTLTTTQKKLLASATRNCVSSIQQLFKPSTPRVSGVHPPPSTVPLNSRTSKASTVDSTPSKLQKVLKKNPDVPTDVFIGGFDDDLDDSEEREAALVDQRKGKKVVKKMIEIVMPSESDSEEIDSPISTSVQSMQLPSQALKSSSFRGRVVSTTQKRKAEELDVPETEGEGSSESDSDVQIMEDHMELDMPAVKLERPLRTTTSTAVTVVTTAVPPSKKVKTEPLELEDTIPSEQISSSSTVQGGRKGRKKFCNTDLPFPPSDPRWLKDFMNTLILWAGSQGGWEIDRHALISSAQIIFDAVFPEIEYEIEFGCPVYAVFTQRLSEWRSNIGSTAIALMTDFCSRSKEVDPEDPDTTPKKPKDIAKQLLAKCCFVYQDPNNPTKETAYFSTFVLQMLAKTHLSAISEAVDIPELETQELALGSRMEGVIMLCVISLERALKFIKDETINVDELLTHLGSSGKLDFKLPKVLNPDTGKVTNRPFQFQEGNWKNETKSYLNSLGKKGELFIQAIVAAAAALLDSKSGSTADGGEANDVQVEIAHSTLSADTHFIAI